MFLSKKKRLIITCIMFFLVLLLTYIGVCEKKRKAECLKKAEYYQDILRSEQQWIIMNQEEEGAIFMNYLSDPSVRLVNPYFACQAAMGLLAGEKSEDRMKTVSEYLKWHTEKLLQSDGKISNYLLADGMLIPTKEYDSVDAYLAVYLNLLASYGEKGGNVSEITGAEEAVQISVEKLSELTNKQLTSVSETMDTYYAMDNFEVCEACENMYHFLKGEKEVFSVETDRVLADEFKGMKEIYQAGIKQRLWNQTEKRFEVGMDGLGNIITFKGWSEFYPDAVVQIYDIACGGYNIREEEARELYDMFCSQFDWENLNTGQTFDWPVIAYIAALMEDLERAETYLDHYLNKYTENREYPLHSADAAWAARTAAVLVEFYQDEAEKNLFDIIKDK